MSGSINILVGKSLTEINRRAGTTGVTVFDGAGGKSGVVDPGTIDRFFRFDGNANQPISIDRAARLLYPTPNELEDATHPLCNDQLLFCQNKTPERILSDFARRVQRYGVVVGTKATQEQYRALKSDEALRGMKVSFDPVGRVITVENEKRLRLGLVVVAATGEADLPVAEEAACIAEAMGNKVKRVYDFCGVNGGKNPFKNASVVIAVAGEGADLPNAIAELTDRPIIAAPTSGRFGVGLKGTENLIGMMKSTAAGVSVVNTDNGFGAAYLADKINRQSLKKRGVLPLAAQPPTGGRGLVVVTTAGSADIPVAEEAAKAAEANGDRVLRLYDRGVNDPENVAANQQAFEEAKVIIVAAGLEGGLPNNIAALTQTPIVAVPTSVGYGTGDGGVASLLCSLNACSPGICVVSIDDGRAAAAMAHKINAQAADEPGEQ